MKILTVVGARPQFIKAAAVSRLFAACEEVEEILLHTGQHYDENMSDLFFRQLEVPAPKYHLGVGSGSHGVQTGRMMEALDGILLHVRPDRVLVYGDTNSTLAGALCASKLKIPTAHVEAGLRSFNRSMPEEINRIVADHLGDLLFAPTETATANLRAEGITPDKIHQVGDVMYDVALYFGARADRESSIRADLGLEDGRYALATVHRAENTDDERRLGCILEGLSQLGERIPVVLPLHPRTRRSLEALGPDPLAPGVRLLDPLGYLDMVSLERGAAVIATDSGGVQKEAFFYRVPCVTLREETEWKELVDLGWNRLAPPVEGEKLAAAVEDAIGSRGHEGAPYGDGNAARRILDGLLHWP